MKLIINVIKEFKLIKWCSLRDWIKSSIVVLLVGIIMALLLTGFDIISAYMMTAINSIDCSASGLVKTTLQVCLSIFSLILLVISFLQSNKGKDILSGLAPGIELFSQTKEVGTDKVLTKIIIILMIIVFGLNIVEGVL